VTVSSFARHMGIPEETFTQWLEAFPTAFKLDTSWVDSLSTRRV
jgi:hypothetical protein